MRREVSKQQQLIRLGIAFVIFVLSSIYYYYRDEAQAETLNAMFNDTVFGIPDVSTKLSFYSETQELLTIKITATGLPESAREYKPGEKYWTGTFEKYCEKYWTDTLTEK